MQYEVRKVPADWKHPKENDSHFKQLKSDYKNDLEGWNVEKSKWDEGLVLDTVSQYPKPTWKKKYEELLSLTFEEATEEQSPNKDDYMPEWPEEECTHFQMYELSDEGTPVSPPMATPEELAQYLVENENDGVVTKGTYDEWIDFIKKGGTKTVAIENKIIWDSTTESGFAEYSGQN